MPNTREFLFSSCLLFREFLFSSWLPFLCVHTWHEARNVMQERMWAHFGQLALHVYQFLAHFLRGSLVEVTLGIRVIWRMIRLRLTAGGTWMWMRRRQRVGVKMRDP